MEEFLNRVGLTHFWQRLKIVLNGKKGVQSAVADPTASGAAVTFIDSITQDAQGVITPTKKTVATMTGATSGAGGAAGLVPAPPASGYNTKYLRADGTWQEPPGGGGGDDLGFYIDAQGYVCQRIGGDP